MVNNDRVSLIFQIKKHKANQTVQIILEKQTKSPCFYYDLQQKCNLESHAIEDHEQVDTNCGLGTRNADRIVISMPQKVMSARA